MVPLRRHHGTLARFAVVGVLNTGLDVAVFSALVYALGLHPVAANTASYSAGVLQSYVLNRSWTFRDAHRLRGLRQLRQLLLFVVLNLVGLGLSNMIVWALVPGVAPLVAKLLAVGATFVWNYVTNRLVIYPAAPDATAR